jgi:hypothetical protein
MDLRAVEHAYKKYFAEMDLERRAFFKTLSKNIDCAAVLYPGSSNHITPSFYFPHVVYVDKNDDARQFFSNPSSVKQFIDRKKVYRRSSYIRFIPMDFCSPLPVEERSYDLLISLYAGGISRACKKYLKSGGILLTNNHHDDAGEAAMDDDFELTAALNVKGKKVKIVEHDLERYFVPRDKKSLKNTHFTVLSDKPEYRINADYYLFRKLVSGG